MEAAKFTGAALSELQVRPVERSEEARYQAQMTRHHYLGELAKIGETVWYIATWHEQWVAQLSLSAAVIRDVTRPSFAPITSHRKALPSMTQGEFALPGIPNETIGLT